MRIPLWWFHADLEIGYAAAWGGLLVFDFVIFTLTLYKSLLLRARCGSILQLLALMLRDGK